MKVAPVSADLLIKLAIIALVAGVGVWAVRKVTKDISDKVASGLATVTAPFTAASEWVDHIAENFNAPYDPSKSYYHLMSTGDQVITPDIVTPFTTLGDLFTSAKPTNTGGASGGW